MSNKRSDGQKNPILTLLQSPTPESIQGGGKNRDNIVNSRLEPQRVSLSEQITNIIDYSSETKKHSGKYHIWSDMYDDSLAPSYTPDSIFSVSDDVRIIIPGHKGYLVEVNDKGLKKIKDRIKSTSTVNDLVDISRIKKIGIYDTKKTLRNRDIDDLWSSTKEESFLFNIWLMPFYDAKAKLSVMNSILDLFFNDYFEFGSPKFDVSEVEHGSFNLGGVEYKLPLHLIKFLSNYYEKGKSSATIKIRDKIHLENILQSSIVYRIDPVSPLTSNNSPTGDGTEPKPPSGNSSDYPTVVVVDGGSNAKSYSGLNVKKIAPLINNFDADFNHGNKVVSMVCNGYDWNNKLKLPKIECSYIIAQAIAKSGVKIQPTPEQFINYLQKVAKETQGLSQVWNFSFNERMPNFYSDEISYLGHRISELSREYNFLPVISIGNASTDNNDNLLCPPSDCESALTVAGRVAAKDGTPAAACKFSLMGPAPGGMKKPELSWFSKLRVIGGVNVTGTSFSAPLISSLAAHTFKNIKNPTPDLVRALLINRSELLSHDNKLGWGTPWNDETMPWQCKEGSVTLTWVSKLNLGASYYWNDIPIPPEMIKDGKLSGKIILTAILKPVTSELAEDNYFSTRLQCALQATKSVDGNIKTKSLLGSMKESLSQELASRSELSKWSPIRHHARSFKGVDIDGFSIRLYSRVYGRDLYQYNIGSQKELDEQEVAFVLTFESNLDNSSIYSSMVEGLGSYIESAVINTEINIGL